MSTVQMRPTFLLETELNDKEVMQRLANSFSRRSDGHEPVSYHGQFTGHHGMISIDGASRHFWSPWMHLEVRSTEQGRQVMGRFSPHPSIWTGFMFSFLMISVLILFAAMFGVSQQLSNQSPWAYYFIPLGLLVIAVLWFVSKAGQKLAQAKMEQMRTRLEECLRE